MGEMKPPFRHNYRGLTLPRRIWRRITILLGVPHQQTFLTESFCQELEAGLRKGSIKLDEHGNINPLTPIKVPYITGKIGDIK